mgnify:CR=1 FL=1
MDEMEKVGADGYPTMLVFAKVIRNIGYDHNTGDEIIEYDNKLKAGFIVEESKSFEQYYLVKYFDGSTCFHWGVDLFYRKEEKNLTNINKCDII